MTHKRRLRSYETPTASSASSPPVVSASSDVRRDKRMANLRPFRKGQSGNPRGGSHLQRLRNRLLKLEPKAMAFIERVLDGDLNSLSFKVLRLALRLAYPEEWKAKMAMADQMPLTVNATTMPVTPEVQELKRVIVDAIAAHTKQKEVGVAQADQGEHGGLES
jgi:hypothetical protein